jgi:hypothetical protein
MEACVGALHLIRLQALGHDARPMPAESARDSKG